MRKEKQFLLDEIKQKIDASSAMIVMRYSALTPNAAWQLRSALAQSGSIFEVVRKRIFFKATQEAGVSTDESLLEGHVGVVFVGQADPMESAKTVLKFSQDNGDILAVLYGRIEGKIVNGSDVVALSKLPSMDEMRSILIGLLTSPMSQMLSVLEAVIAEPLSVVEQKS